MSQFPFALQLLVLIVSGWVNHQQQLAIEYLLEENRVLREQLGNRRLRLTDAQRRRLAVRGKALGRKALDELAGLVTPATILRWYRTLVVSQNSIAVSVHRSGAAGELSNLDRRGCRVAGNRIVPNDGHRARLSFGTGRG
jgi:hypothetical protein